MSEWKTVKIDEIAVSMSMGPFGSDIKTSNFVDDGVPIIRGGNLIDGKFNDDNFVYLTEEKADSLKNSNAFPGDIVFTHRGTLGQVGLIPSKARYPRYVVSQSQMRMTCDVKKADPKFVYYFFLSPIGKNELLSNTSTTGVPAISRPLSSLKKINIPLPPLETQKKIADILSSFDDKIELNIRMNKVLEDISEALFKHWFVEFEFPNHEGKPYKSSGGKMVDSEMGLIPEGWRVGTIGDIVKVVGGSTPDTKNPEYWDYGTSPFCTPKDLANLKSPILFDTERHITDKGVQSISSKQLPAETLLLSSRAPIGYTAICNVPVSINQGFIALICNEQVSNVFLLQWIKENMDKIKGRANGSTFLEINKQNFRKIPFLISEQNILNKYNAIVGKLYEEITMLTKENMELIKIRDVLLPKLMNGDIIK